MSLSPKLELQLGQAVMVDFHSERLITRHEAERPLIHSEFWTSNRKKPIIEAKAVVESRMR